MNMATWSILSAFSCFFFRCSHVSSEKMDVVKSIFEKGLRYKWVKFSVQLILRNRTCTEVKIKVYCVHCSTNQNYIRIQLDSILLFLLTLYCSALGNKLGKLIKVVFTVLLLLWAKYFSEVIRYFINILFLSGGKIWTEDLRNIPPNINTSFYF